MGRNAQRDATASKRPGRSLDHYYREVQSIILARQNPITGLMPASTAITVHGDYTDAWVRDNVYSILAPWALALAHRRDGGDRERAYTLEQSVVKLMRGLLISMMKQSDKVEAFKQTLDPIDALHAKYNTRTGDTVVADDAWGHLQLDATSLFLLMLAQMTASGLRIVFSLDEVHFVQNLVYYISRAYLTPDYGLWERGDKSNDGRAEINASSVGMAKAALEALQGFNLFGADGSPASVIHVVEDDIAHARATLETLLPRESASKETDAALLSIIGFPAYAVDDPELVQRTRWVIVDKLQGKYGCKRFLRDGHQTVLEDHERLHYEAGELQLFEHIESEWPLFFTYLLVDGLMRGDSSQAEFYRNALSPLFVERDDQRLLPELYFVPGEHIEAEKAEPHSQPRQANDNLPLVWAQSLSIVGSLLEDGHLQAADLDPLERRQPRTPVADQPVKVALVAENARVQARLRRLGIPSQTPDQLAPLRLANAAELAQALCQLGRCPALGLSGRPLRNLDTLSTARVYSLDGDSVVFLPAFLHARHSYLQLDNHFIVEQLRSELHYLRSNWRQAQAPLVTLMISDAMLRAPGHRLLAELLRDLRKQRKSAAGIELCRLSDAAPMAVHQDLGPLPDFHLDGSRLYRATNANSLLPSQRSSSRRLSARELADFRASGDGDLLQALQHSRNLYAHIELISLLWQRCDPRQPVCGDTSLRELAEQTYQQAAEWRQWGVMRRAAALLGWYDERLQDELARLVGRGLRVALGRAFSSDVLIQQPLSNADILNRIQHYGGDDPRVQLLLQELLLLLGRLLILDPGAFAHTYTLQCWHLLLLLNGELAWERDIGEDEAFEELLELSPQALLQRLHNLLTHTSESLTHLHSVESLRIAPFGHDLRRVVFNSEYSETLASSPDDAGKEHTDWGAWRKLRGGVIRLSDDFCAQVWGALGQCTGMVIGDRLNTNSRLESAIVRADMTPGEKNLALLIEDKLNHIQAPEYRQLVLEALQVVATIFLANPELKLDSHLVFDVLIGHAVRQHWRANSGEPVSETNSASSWDHFFAAPPHAVANALVAAFHELLVEQRACAA